MSVNEIDPLQTRLICFVCRFAVNVLLFAFGLELVSCL